MHGALEEILKHEIERVEKALVLHQRCPRQVVEFVDIRPCDAFLQRFQERQVFPDRNRYPGITKVIKELDKHLLALCSGGAHPLPLPPN